MVIVIADQSSKTRTKNFFIISCHRWKVKGLPACECADISAHRDTKWRRAQNAARMPTELCTCLCKASVSAVLARDDKNQPF